jgi:hypothetical protein
MKNIHGLILALGMGIAAAMLNWAYLNSEARRVDMVDFIGVKPGVTIGRGERLVDENLVAVPVPMSQAGELNDFAIRHSDLQTVVTQNVTRTITGGSLLLRDDLRTPPPELTLKEDEIALFIPVDTRSFVPSLVKPGDMVWFLVFSDRAAASPTPADGATAPTPAAGPPVPPAGTEAIGPFRVLSLGNRLGSADAMKAAGIPQTQENVMTIPGKLTAGKLEPKEEKLLKYLHATNYRNMPIMLSPR